MGRLGQVVCWTQSFRFFVLSLLYYFTVNVTQIVCEIRVLNEMNERTKTKIGEQEIARFGINAIRLK